jgi:hypothetical protein
VSWPAITHVGVGPDWDCVACTQPWPCAQAKEELLVEFKRFPSSLTIYMSAYLSQAIEDYGAHGKMPPPDLWDRFIGWIKATNPAP